MRFLLILIIALSLFRSAHAQKEGQALVDSLNAELPRMKADTNKVRLLATISYEMKHINPRAGLDPGFKALTLAMKLNDLYGQGLARFSIALNYNYLSLLSESIEQSIQAGAIFEKLGNTDLLAATWFGLAQTYMSFDTAASRRTMMKAKSLLPRNSNPVWIVRNYGSLGNSYKNLDQKDSAMKYILLHLKLAEKYRMKWQIMMAKNRIGSMYYFAEKPDSAYPLLKEALDYFRSVGANQMVAQNSQTLGLLIKGRIPGAGAKKKAYLDAAIAYGEEALYASGSIGFVMQLLGSSRLLADLYAMKGDTGTAYKYLLMSEKYYEKLYGVKVVTRASMLNVKNEQRLKNQQLELLELKNREQLIFIIISACGVVILFIVVLLIINSRRKVKKAYDLVNTQKEEIIKVLGELEATNLKLESTNQELEAFSYSVSHDLRAPVRRIEGLSAMLKEDYGNLLDAEGKDFLNRITDSSALMNTLIEDMLQLSHITRQTVTKAPCNVSEMAAKICEDLRPVYPGLEFDCSIEEGIVINADSHLLKIALQNLLDNAFKYSSRTEHPEVLVRSEMKDNRTNLIIQDNGAGFDMSKAGKLFTPFQRMHTDEQFKGTGIGLATVKRIIVKHGGTISVSSEPGKGTSFSLTFE
jgi:signal transduction histidine kinase